MGRRRGHGVGDRPNGRRAGIRRDVLASNVNQASTCLPPPVPRGDRHITRCPPQPGSHRVRAPKVDGPAIRHRPTRHQATAKMKALAGSDTPAHPPLARGTRGRRPFLSSVLQRRENRVRKSYSMAMNAVSVGNRAPAQAGTQVKSRSACNPGLLPAQEHSRTYRRRRCRLGSAPPTPALHISIAVIHAAPQQPRSAAPSSTPHPRRSRPGSGPPTARESSCSRSPWAGSRSARPSSPR